MSTELSTRLRLAERPALGDTRKELFTSQQPATPPAALKATPERPAPPLPYRFAGVIVAGGERQVYLARADESMIEVKEGTTLDGVYRVDSISDAAIGLTYLPLRRKESIAVASILLAAAPAAEPTATAATTPSPAGSAQLQWDGPKSVRVGVEFKVGLRVTSSQALGSTPVQLRFDPSLLEAVAVTPGRTPTGERMFASHVSADGVISVSAIRDGHAPLVGAELLVVTLKPVKPAAAAELDLASLALQNESGLPVEHATLAAYRTAITR